MVSKFIKEATKSSSRGAMRKKMSAKVEETITPEKIKRSSKTKMAATKKQSVVPTLSKLPKLK
jgi:hypothetical protein